MADRSCRPPTKHLLKALPVVAALALVATACTGGDAGDHATPSPGGQASPGENEDTLLVYGRTGESELFKEFEQQTGIDVLPRAGNLDDLANQIIEEGDDSPADVYYAPLSDALGLLRAAGRLTPLSDEQLDRVPAAYRAPDDTWVGTSGRALVVVYNTDLLSEDDLPDSIEGFTDPAWRGRIGWDPANRSLQGGISALRQLEGEDRARAWLEGVEANDPAVLEGPENITRAVSGGKVAEVGFSNHFYVEDLQAEGLAENVAAKYYPGDPAGVLNPSGVGIVKGTDNEAAANAFVDFTLSQAAQRTFSEVNLEIPFVEGIEPPGGVPPAGEFALPGLDLEKQESLEGTRDLLTDAGLLE